MKNLTFITTKSRLGLTLDDQTLPPKVDVKLNDAHIGHIELAHLFDFVVGATSQLPSYITHQSPGYKRRQAEAARIIVHSTEES